MKKVSLVLAIIFLSVSSIFANVDAKNITEIINGVNYAKFSLDRLETVANVHEPLNVKIGASIQDITSSIISSDYAVIPTDIDDAGNITTSGYDQSFLFPSKIFLGFSMTVNGVSFGFGYQFAYSALTLDDLGLGVQTFTDGSIKSDRLITSHSFSFGMTLLDNMIEFNTPFSITVADNSYYSTYLSKPITVGGRPTSKGNVAFSMLPNFTYNATGDTFKYVTGEIGFGINHGTDVYNNYEEGYAVAISLKAEALFNIITDPITIALEPVIYASVGINSSSAIINALYTTAHKVQYDNGNTPVLTYIKAPVRFESYIGSAISLYVTPEIGIFYAQDGDGYISIDEINIPVYGAMYGIEAGIEFRPIDDLTFNFDLNAIGGPSYVLEDDDYVYVVNSGITNGPSFTFGLNASVKWYF